MCFPLVFLMPATLKMPESMGTLKSHIKTSWVSSVKYQLQRILQVQKFNTVKISNIDHKVFVTLWFITFFLHFKLKQVLKNDK